MEKREEGEGSVLLSLHVCAFIIADGRLILAIRAHFDKNSYGGLKISFVTVDWTQDL